MVGSGDSWPQRSSNLRKSQEKRGVQLRGVGEGNSEAEAGPWSCHSPDTWLTLDSWRSCLSWLQQPRDWGQKLHFPLTDSWYSPHFILFCLLNKNWQKSNSHSSSTRLVPSSPSALSQLPSLQEDPGPQHLSGDLVDPERGREIGVIALGGGVIAGAEAPMSAPRSWQWDSRGLPGEGASQG